MYNTNKGGFVPAGACPSSHPVRTPQVALETMWDTRPFNDKSIWPEDGSQPFVWSYEDSVGYGTHADYVFGWKGDSLQKAMDSGCNLNRDCPAAGLHAQQPAQYNACMKQQQAPEEVDGCKFHPESDHMRTITDSVDSGLAQMPMGEMAVKA